MKNRDAYVFWQAGTCYIVNSRTQFVICESTHFRRATRRARNLGFAVRVYSDDPAKAPRDAIKVTRGSYVLPASHETESL